MSLTVVIATRHRPELLHRTITTVLANITLADTRLMVACDLDDEVSCDAVGLFNEALLSIAPREDSPGAKWNRAISVCPANAYYAMVDHSPVVTLGFDKLIHEALAKFEDGYGYLGGPLANLNFPSAQIVTHKLAVAMGGIYPEHFPYWFIDHWLDDIAQMIGRRGYVPIEIDVSRRPNKTMELRDLYFWATLYDCLASERRRTAAGLIFGSMDFATPPWLAAILYQGWPQIDRRSFLINQGCRSYAKQMEAERGTRSPPDERYLRLKARAEALIKGAYPQLKAA